MKILLDTHCWLWYLSMPERLSNKALDCIIKPENQIYLSAVSSWEISIKVMLGKLNVPEPQSSFVSKALRSSHVKELPLSMDHTEVLYSLPPIHADPFDRILIAQAISEGMHFLTADKTLKKYKAEFIWT